MRNFHTTSFLLGSFCFMKNNLEIYLEIFLLGPKHSLWWASIMILTIVGEGGYSKLIKIC